MRFFAEPKYSSRERIYSDIYISGLSDENELKYLFSGWIPKGSMGGYVESDDYLGKGIFDLCLYKDPSASAFIEHSRISMDAACTFVPILDYYNGWCLICIGDKKGWTRNMVEKCESIKWDLCYHQFWFFLSLSEEKSQKFFRKIWRERKSAYLCCPFEK